MQYVDALVLFRYYDKKELIILATTNLNVRIDESLKKQSEKIFNELGLTMSTALTVFFASNCPFQRNPL